METLTPKAGKCLAERHRATREVASFVTAFAVSLSISGRQEWLRGRDGYFHLAVGIDYVASPFEYNSRLAEGLLARYPADKEPLFHLAIAGLLRLGLGDAAALHVLGATACGLIALSVCRATGSMTLSLGAIASSALLLHRLVLPRPHVLAVAAVVAGVLLLEARRYKLFGIVNVFYCLSYSVPVLLFAAAMLCSVFRKEWRPAVAAIVSTSLAVLVHPHFSDNLVVFWYQGPCAGWNLLLGDASMPAELHRKPLGMLILCLWLPLSAWICGIVTRKASGWQTAFQGLLFVGAGLVGRGLEYAGPAAFASSGTALRNALRGPVMSGATVVRVLLWLLFAVNVVVNLSAHNPEPAYRQAAMWLRGPAAGQTVFNEEWDAYPALVYFGRSFKVVQGHDPLFMRAYCAARAEEVSRAALGKMSITEFRKTFGIRFVVGRARSPICRVFGGDPTARVAHSHDGIMVIDLGPPVEPR